MQQWQQTEWHIRFLLSFIILLLTSNVNAQQMPPLGIQDEGGTIRRPVTTINCVGSGIGCTFSVNKGILTVSGGAATDTDSVVTLEVNNTVEQSGTFTLDFDGSQFQSTESPTDEENISIKDIYVLNTSDVMSGTISASNLSGTNTGDQNLSTYVVGPGSATDNAICRYDSTTGKLVQNSSATVDDSGWVTTPRLIATDIDSSGGINANEIYASGFFSGQYRTSLNSTGISGTFTSDEGLAITVEEGLIIDIH